VQVTVESLPAGITVIRLAEGLDMSNVPTFRQTLQSEIDRAQHGLVLLLSEVPFIDSSGIAVLIEGLKWSRQRTIPYVLAQLTPAVQMVIELARLQHFFTIAEDLEAATDLIASAP